MAAWGKSSFGLGFNPRHRSARPVCGGEPPAKSDRMSVASYGERGREGGREGGRRERGREGGREGEGCVLSARCPVQWRGTHEEF